MNSISIYFRSDSRYPALRNEEGDVERPEGSAVDPLNNVQTVYATRTETQQPTVAPSGDDNLQGVQSIYPARVAIEQQVMTQEEQTVAIPLSQGVQTVYAEQEQQAGAVAQEGATVTDLPEMQTVYAALTPATIQDETGSLRQ